MNSTWNCHICGFESTLQSLFCLVCTTERKVDIAPKIKKSSRNATKEMLKQKLWNEIMDDNQFDTSSSDESIESQQESKCNDIIHCESAKDCKAITRIIELLKVYQNHTINENDIKLTEYVQSYDRMLNDYHHILDKHDDRRQFECLYAKIMEENIECDLIKCNKLVRNLNVNGIIESENKSIDIQKMIYEELLDTIHCNLIHSFDMGYRIRSDKIEYVTEGDTALVHMDATLKSIKSVLFEKRDNLRKLKRFERLNTDKFCTHFSKQKSVKNHNEEKKESNDDNDNGFIQGVEENDDDEDDDEKKTFLDELYVYLSSYYFNEEYLTQLRQYIKANEYDTDSLKDDVLYQLYEDDQHEEDEQHQQEDEEEESMENCSNIYLLINSINDIENDDNMAMNFMDAFLQFIEFNMNEESELKQYSFGVKYNYTELHRPNEISVKKKYDSLKEELMNNNIHTIDSMEWMMKLEKAKYYSNASNSIRRKLDLFRITVHHLLAVIFYTDTNELQNSFSLTYRAIKANESKSSIIKRHREFYHWGKLLNEVVNHHGTKIENSDFHVFYHGVSFLYFDAFIAEFCSPTSTTTSLEIAAGFAKSDGIILELKRHVYGYGNPRYFDCELISKFDWEKEKLFIGGQRGWDSGPLQFNSIRLMETDENFEHFVNFLTVFNEIIDDHSEWYAIQTRAESYESISSLIECIVINKNIYDYPEYIMQCFKQFCNKQKGRLLIDLDHKCWINLLHLQHNNLLRFDVISNKLFPNCTAIDCATVGYVSTAYLDALLIILEMMRNNNDEQDKVTNKIREIMLFDVLFDMMSDDEFRIKRIKFGKKGFYMELREESVITIVVENKEDPDFTVEPIRKHIGEEHLVAHRGEVVDTNCCGEHNIGIQRWMRDARKSKIASIRHKIKYGKIRKIKMRRNEKKYDRDRYHSPQRNYRSHLLL